MCEAVERNQMPIGSRNSERAGEATRIRARSSSDDDGRYRSATGIGLESLRERDLRNHRAMNPFERAVVTAAVSGAMSSPVVILRWSMHWAMDHRLGAGRQLACVCERP